MALAWLVYLMWLWISFREPARESEVNNVQQESNGVENDKLEKGLAQPLLLTSTENEYDDEGDQEFDGSEEAPEESRLPANSLGSAYRRILLASEIVVLLGILFSFHIIIPYSVPQYVVSGLVMFVSAEVLDFCIILMTLFFLVIIAVNLSLLSQVMPFRLSRGTYNDGLLLTEAGTLARVIPVFADGRITLAWYLGQDRLLNATLLPSLVICIGSIVATCCTFNDLF